MHRACDQGFRPRTRPDAGRGRPNLRWSGWRGARRKARTGSRWTCSPRSPVATTCSAKCSRSGQNRRWRRCMVDHAIGRARPVRILDVASGTAGVAIALARRTEARVVAYDLTLPMLRQGAARVETPGSTDRIDLVEGRAERLPFPDDSLRRADLHLPLALRRRPRRDPARSWPGWCGRAAAVASLEFLAPPSPLWGGPPGGAYTRLVLPVAGWLTGGREWWRVGRFLGPNISGHYRRYPVPWTVGAWEDGRFGRRRGASDEPRRRPGHVGPACRWLSPGPRHGPGAPAARLLRRSAGGMARLVDASPSALHRLASLLCRGRRLSGPGCPGRPAGRDAARVLPRGRPRRARARRASGPPTRDPHPLPVARGDRGRRHRRRGRARRDRRRPGGMDPRAIHRRRPAPRRHLQPRHAVGAPATSSSPPPGVPSRS